MLSLHGDGRFALAGAAPDDSGAFAQAVQDRGNVSLAADQVFCHAGQRPSGWSCCPREGAIDATQIFQLLQDPVHDGVHQVQRLLDVVLRASTHVVTSCALQQGRL